MRQILVLVAVFIWSFACAQDELSTDLLVPDKAIKVSPLHLLNFYPTIEVSYEQKVKGNVTAQAEVGYVVDFRTDWDREFLNKRGVKLKLEGRYYFWGRIDRKKLYYISAEPYMNVINFDRENARIECFDLECVNRYRITSQYKVEYREHGFSVKAGLIRYTGNKLFFDVNSGFTLRNVRYREPAFPGEFSFDEDDTWSFFDIPNEEDRIGFSPCLSARIGYRLQ